MKAIYLFFALCILLSAKEGWRSDHLRVQKKDIRPDKELTLHIEEYMDNEEGYIDGSNASIVYRGKVIDTLAKDYYRSISLLYSGDLDRDGYPEYIVEGYTGGAHCCYEYFIYSKKNMNKKLFLDLGNSSMAVKTAAGKNPVLYFIDDIWSYFESLCFACSPGPMVFANYKHGKIFLDRNMTRNYNMEKITENKKYKNVDVSLDPDGTVLFADEPYAAGSLVDLLVRSLYSGEYRRTKKMVLKYFKGNNHAVQTLFDKIVKRASKSRFWRDISDMNGLE